MNEPPCLFETNTIYDQHAYRALVELMLRKLRRWPRTAILTLGFGTLILAGYRIFTITSFDVISVLFLLLGNAIILFAVFAEHFLIQMLCAETGKKKALVNDYRFFQNYLEIISNPGRTDRVSYDRISRILEYKHYFFLFIDGRTAYILDPSALRMGTETNLRRFLDEKLM